MSRLVQILMLISLVGALGLGGPLTLQAADRIGGTSACSPTEPEPEAMQTRLGSFAATPSIAAVGSIVTLRVTAPSDPVYSMGASPLPGGWAELFIGLPPGEVLDWAPRTVAHDGTVAVEPFKVRWLPGNRAAFPPVPGGPAGTIPGGEFYVRVKLTEPSDGTWRAVSYGIQSPTQGWGRGQDALFIYQERVPVHLDVADLEVQPDGSTRARLALDAEGSDRLLVRTTAGELVTPSGRGVIGEVQRSDFGQVSLTIPAGAEAKVFARSPDACHEDAFWLTVSADGVTDRSAPPVDDTTSDGAGQTAETVTPTDDSGIPWLPIAVGGGAAAAGLGYALWRFRARSQARPTAELPTTESASVNPSAREVGPGRSEMNG